MADPTCQCSTCPDCRNQLAGKKYMHCRPCSLGNHTGAPCSAYEPEYPKHIIRTCRSCGFDSALHPPRS